MVAVVVVVVVGLIYKRKFQQPPNERRERIYGKYLGNISSYMW